MGKRQLKLNDNYMTDKEFKDYKLKDDRQRIKPFFETYLTESLNALMTVGSSGKMLGIEGNFPERYLLKVHKKAVLELTDELIDDSLDYGVLRGLKIKKVYFVVTTFKDEKLSQGPSYSLNYVNADGSKEKALKLIKKILKENNNISISSIKHLGIYE